LEDKLAGKEKFVRVLEDKLARQAQQENNPNHSNQQPQRNHRLEKTMESVEQLKIDRLRSFERIVRSKNAILLKSKSQRR